VIFACLKYGKIRRDALANLVLLARAVSLNALFTTLTVNFSKDLKVQNFDDPRRQTF